MGSRRNMGFLLLVLLATAVAVAINLFADDEAQRIAAGGASAPASAPAAGADDNRQANGAGPVTEPEPEYDPALVDTPQCQRAQAEFDGVWDASIESPEDPALEEALEIALSEVNAACGG